MVALPLAHVSWAIADNADRKACDAFFQAVFGARTAYEMLVTPEGEAMGLDREESLMMVGDTMIVPIAPAGNGANPGAPVGDMLRRSAIPMRWIGLALRVADLAEADAWFRARGFTLHYDPGMETVYFLIGRGQVMGIRLEILAHDLPGDPRLSNSWTPAFWRDDHPLGIEALQAIGVSAPSLDEAHALFAERLALAPLGRRFIPSLDADCAAYDLGDTVIEALSARDPSSSLGAHARDIKGIHSLVFQVKDAVRAAGWLQGQGFDLVGRVDDRFAIDPRQAQGRLIWLTQDCPDTYPQSGSDRKSVV